MDILYNIYFNLASTKITPMFTNSPTLEPGLMEVSFWLSHCEAAHASLPQGLTSNHWLYVGVWCPTSNPQLTKARVSCLIF